VKAWNRHALLASFTSHKRIDIFEAILTELNIAGPKDARQVDIHLLRSFGRPTQLCALKTRTGDPGS
jgi:hypothetical protein